MIFGKQVQGRTMRRLGLAAAASLASVLAVGCMEDSVLGDDEKFMPPIIDTDTDTDAGEYVPNDCDMTGTWMAQLLGSNQAVGILAHAYNWFYYEVTDNGDDVTIDRGWDCGFQVCGKASQLALTHHQMEQLSLRNRQDGGVFINPSNAAENIVVSPRKTTFKKLADGSCELSMERWWSVRSAPPSYLPARADYTTATLASVKAANPLPPRNTTASAPYDIDGDNIMGMTLMMDTPWNGERAAIQRDWNEFGPGTVPDGSEDFTIVARFDNEETIYWVNQSVLDSESIPVPGTVSVRFVKIDQKAPEDLPGFRTFCEDQINTVFRRPGIDDYCNAMILQKPPAAE